MKFQIKRTSSWGNKPCDEAFLDKYTRIDARTTDDPCKIPCYFDNPEKAKKMWFGEGSNHRVENGWIKRDFEDEGWFIEINSLEELMKFHEKYGNLVINSDYSSSISTLEIYDDYRE